MANPLDRLFLEFHELGAPVLLARLGPLPAMRPAEEVIAESTAHCRESGRLTWIVLDWLIHHIDEIDDSILLDRTRSFGDLSVLGVLSEAAQHKRRHPKFRKIISGCRPNRSLEPFFHRVAQSPLASRLARENAVDIFRRWNYLSNELQYLDDKRAW